MEIPMNQTALITGGSRGLGKALATFLVGQGYDLIVTARDRQKLAEAQESLRSFGTRIVALPGDVAEEPHRDSLALAAEELGGLDLLVNNASDLGATPLPPLAEYSLPRLRQVFETNIVAPLALIQKTLTSLALRNGLAVNVSSEAGIGGYPGWGVYGASKASLDLISTTLSNELADLGVAVVSVDPGDMRTDMQQAAFPDEDISDRPLPEATLPFWAWLLGQPQNAITGQRFRAQSETWELVT